MTNIFRIFSYPPPPPSPPPAPIFETPSDVTMLMAGVLEHTIVTLLRNELCKLHISSYIKDTLLSDSLYHHYSKYCLLFHLSSTNYMNVLCNDAKIKCPFRSSPL